MQSDGIDRAEGCGWSKAIDPVLFAVVTGVACAVTAAIPWFKTDERCVLGRR